MEHIEIEIIEEAKKLKEKWVENEILYWCKQFYRDYVKGKVGISEGEAIEFYNRHIEAGIRNNYLDKLMDKILDKEKGRM
jgi:hypothetical protein